MNRWSDWDESRVRVRPNKRGSRPRTKESPKHPDAVIGRVITVDRGRYTVRIAGTKPSEDRLVTAVRAKALGRKHEGRTAVVPGDVVGLVGDTSGSEGTLARLVRVEQRSTLLRRSADDTDEAERVIVANADQLLIVVAAAKPQPRLGFIDRALVAAYDARVEPILLITKADLAEDPRDPAGLLSHYAELDVETVVSGHMNPGGQSDEPALSPAAVGQLRSMLSGKVTVLIGPSGVGKSTMVNVLTGADRATGGVNAVTGRGRHTSSSAVALQLESEDEQAQSSWIIDTPGIRSFGLAHVEPDDVLDAFADLVEGSADCEPGCLHESPEGGCALDAYVAAGHAGAQGAARLASLRGLLASLSGASEGPGEKKLGSVEP